MRRGGCGRGSWSATGAMIAGMMAAPALAGGSPERTLLIIDPANPTSLYLGNYYKHARNIPDSHVLYMQPGAFDFQEFRDQNIPALLGTMAHREIADSVDFVVVSADDRFFISAPGLVNDGCSPVRRFSLSGAYTMSFIADEVLGGLPITTSNRYFSPNEARAFSSEVRYLGGRPSGSPSARRYLLGTQLGYTGERGNTIDDLIAMIDRSVAVDGTFPAGTFYFMETNDSARSDPRDGLFDAAVSAIQALGGQAVHLMGILPPAGSHDCLGIMTGIAEPGVDNADITILPGAICDHLTSFAATFDTSAQEKLSRWIANGASGSWGAVEEPCNYAQKFPHPKVHAQYFEGLSLGEALLRSVAFVPFQMLLYGDPLTRPFAHIPGVSITNMPTEPVGEDAVVLDYVGTTTHPDATVSRYQLFIDGRRVADIDDGFPLVLLTSQLSDGWHELRLLGSDSTLIESAGSFVAPLIVDRRGQEVSVAAQTTAGDLGTLFSFDVHADVRGAVQVRLVQNGRVLDSVEGCGGTLSVHGSVLGAGITRVQGEALLYDGTVVRSEPIELSIDFAGSTPMVPEARGYTMPVLMDEPVLVPLPVTTSAPMDQQGWVVLEGPAQATLLGDHEGYVILDPDAGASGSDTIRFRVDSPDGNSQTATVTILYEPYPLDVDGDGDLTLADLVAYFQNPVDANLDGLTDMNDTRFLLDAISCGAGPMPLGVR